MKLTKILTLGAFACSSMSLMAGPAPVIEPPEPAGCGGLRTSLGVTLGHTWLNDVGGNAIEGDEKDEFLSALIELRLGYDLSSSWYGQLDIIGEFTDVPTSSGNNYEKGQGAAFHLLRKTGDNSGIGIFGGWFKTQQDDNRTDSSERFLGGIEGIGQLGKLDIHWQIGGIVGNAGNDDYGRDSLRDFYFGRVVASNDLGNGWRAGAEISGGSGTMDDSHPRDDFELFGWGVFVSKQLSPDWLVSIVYNGIYYEQDSNGSSDDDNITENFVGINLTYYFGAGSNDDCAPNLSLPPILRWMGTTGGPME